jgi:uncharacterized protein
MPLLVYPANDIDTAGIAVDAELPAAWLDAELADAEARGRAAGRVTTRLSRSGDEIVVRGRVKAALEVPCARCLAPAAVDVDTELSLLLRPAPSASPAHGRAAGREGGKEASKRPHAHDTRTNGRPRTERDDEPEYEFSAAEAEHDTYDGETVVLDSFVREALLLELPNFPLCSEACPGIGPADPEPADEVEPPIDPRLAPLGALREKLAGKGALPPEPTQASEGPPAKSAKTKKSN